MRQVPPEQGGGAGQDVGHLVVGGGAFLELCAQLVAGLLELVAKGHAVHRRQVIARLGLSGQRQGKSDGRKKGRAKHGGNSCSALFCPKDFRGQPP
jgi:hypothetical protein